MTDINLLPWREKRREQEKKHFMFYLIGGVFFAIVIVFFINYYATSLVDAQTKRNQQLKQEITQFDIQIKDISHLKQLRQELIARMAIVKNLLATRTLTVRLFDEIINIMPDGIYLNHVDRVGDKITLIGYAESNASISQLMRNIERSNWIQDPELSEIKKIIEAKKIDQNEFNLSFILKPKTNVGAK